MSQIRLSHEEVMKRARYSAERHIFTRILKTIGKENYDVGHHLVVYHETGWGNNRKLELATVSPTMRSAKKYRIIYKSPEGLMYAASLARDGRGIVGKPFCMQEYELKNKCEFRPDPEYLDWVLLNPLESPEHFDYAASYREEIKIKKRRRDENKEHAFRIVGARTQQKFMKMAETGQPFYVMETILPYFQGDVREMQVIGINHGVSITLSIKGPSPHRQTEVVPMSEWPCRYNWKYVTDVKPNVYMLDENDE